MDGNAATSAEATDAEPVVVPEVIRAGTVSYADAVAWFEKRRPTYVRLAEAVRPYVPRDGMVLDIGANIGYFTKILGETLGLTGAVHLFEPLPNLAAHCRVTTDALPFETVVHEYGLSDEDGEVELFTDVSGNLGWNTLIAERATGLTANKIQVRKFVPDELGGTPAFVKIDVEGAESKVLSGMLEAFESWSPRPPLLCEIGWGQGHPHWKEELAVFARLLDLGYQVFDLTGRALDLTSLTKTTDVLFLPEGVRPGPSPAGTGPVRLSELAEYADDRGNRITYNGALAKRVRIKFTGSNNTLIVDDDAAVLDSVFDFDCDNGFLRIGTTRKGGTPLRAHIRVGQDGQVLIGDNVSATTPCAMSAAEGAIITIGDDVMFASANAVRADDGHPIFDVRSGKRVNTSRPITIGNHVWLGKDAAVLGGVTIGDGSVVGYASVVTKDIPNNCIAAGVPAKVVRRDIAWERPHLTLTKPYYKTDSSTVSKSPYWHLTAEPGQAKKAPSRLNPTVVRRGLKRRARKLKARLQAGKKG